VLVQIHPDEAGLLQEIDWGIVLALKQVAGDTEIKKEQPMRLQEWETTIQKIIDECNHEQEGGGKDSILMKWRTKLEKEPTLLQPFQIDEIVREVRQRLSSISR
jgi:hypothetical protein